MDFDVIIAGAGPAGSTCARLCAAAGIRTLLLERDPFPRPKPCGGALSVCGRSHLGIALPPELIERECFGARVHYGSRAVEVRKDQPVAVKVDRERFDSYLAEQAAASSAVLRQQEPLLEFQVSDDRVTVRTAKGRYEARCLVGADGAYSMVGQRIRPLFPRDEIFAALVGSCRTGDRTAAGHPDDLLEFYFGVTPMGYGWVFPEKDGYTVGVMGRALEFEAPQKVFGAFASSVGLPVERPRGHTIPMGGFARPVIGRRTILVGDAAGFADPFHGEGMENAILSGKLAAMAIVEGIRGRKDALTWYQQECDRLIVQEMKIALSLAMLLDRHPRLCLTIFFSGPEALDRYLDIAAGRSTYTQFRKWLLPRLPKYLLASLLRKEPAFA